MSRSRSPTPRRPPAARSCSFISTDSGDIDAGQAIPAYEMLDPVLPLPMVNMISGGLHAGGNLDIQDVLIIPVGATSYTEALEMIVAVYRAVGAGPAGPRLRVEPGRRRGRLRAAAPEQRTGVRSRRGRDRRPAVCEPGRDVAIAVDVASTHFYDPDRGHLSAPRRRRPGRSTANGMIDLLAGWTERYPIVSVEDGLAEDDWAGWTAITKRLPRSVQLIGDDLFATQVARLRQGIDRQAGNAVLIKLNQVGTLSETFEALRTGKKPRFSHGRLCPIGRDRGYNDRRPGRRDRRRPDQDWLGGAFRKACEIQPIAPHRRRAGPECGSLRDDRRYREKCPETELWRRTRSFFSCSSGDIASTITEGT